MTVIFLPMIFWALSSVMTTRAVRHYGPAATNRKRLLIALGILGLWILAGPGFPKPSRSWAWLLFSGAVGLGLGDLAMLAGYRKVGARLTVLLLLCLAVPVAGVSEWIWIGTPITWRTGVLILTLLTGVTISVWPGEALPIASGRVLAWGIFYGVLAALGQGVATTLSRVAYDAARAGGADVNGTVAAWQRMVGGLLCTLVAERFFRRSAGEPPLQRAGELMVSPKAALTGHHPLLWLLLATLCGQVLGLTAYQRALVTHSGILVQAVSTLTPVAVIPLAWWFEGDKPGWRGIIGGAVACASAIALILWK
ncbi:MAG: DMT family transporter [Kiritimatiellia bacterium]|nr:DMT family transporter [Kiritimatiellia bacterium]